MTCVVNFVFALSQLQGVEWGWPGRREPDDEHSPASYRGGIASSSFISFFTCILRALLCVFLFFFVEEMNVSHFVCLSFPSVRYRKSKVRYACSTGTVASWTIWDVI